VDHFSARWTGKIGPSPDGKPLHLAVTADDGVRVWIDGVQVVNEWHAQDAVTTVTKLALEPGSTHDIKVEYYEGEGDALCKLEGQTDLSAAGQRSVWIPNGTWIDAWSGARLVGPQTVQVTAPLSQMPMYLREGAIIPLAPAMQYTSEHSWSPLTLEVYPSEKVSQFTLYEDDGKSNNYKKGEFRTTRIFTRIAKDGTILLTIAPTKGTFEGASEERSWKVRFHVPHGTKVSGVTISGAPAGNSKQIPPADSIEIPLTGEGASVGEDVIEVEIPTSAVTVLHSVQVK